MAVSKNPPLKYIDKSSGQEALIPIFEKIKKQVSRYVKGKYVVQHDLPGNYSMYYRGTVEVQDRKFPELCFATILIQKGYVGFYFFPIYVHPFMKEKLPSGLLSHLKGKTCFHIKKADPVLFAELEQALQTGYLFYVSRGWS